MSCYEKIDLLCSLISTFSIIISGIVVCHHYLRKLSARAIYDNNYLSIFVCPLLRPVTIKEINIKIGKQLLNPDDIFFSNGETSIAIDLNNSIVIKQIAIKNSNAKIAKLKIILSDNRTSYHLCRIRRT